MAEEIDQSIQRDMAPSMRRERLATIQLAIGRRFVSKGGGGAVYNYTQVGPVFENLGQHLEAIQAFTVLRDMSTNFKFKVKGQWSNDRMQWTDFSADLVADVTAEGQGKTVHSTTTDYGLHIRFLVGASDAGAVEDGNVTLVVALKTAGQ